MSHELADDSWNLLSAGVAHERAVEPRHARPVDVDVALSLAVFVPADQRDRVAAAGIEDKRVAPLQPRDRFAFARLLCEQIADRFLFVGLRRGDADVDFLRVGPRVPEQAWVDEVVVQHDVGRHQTLQTADGDQSGISGAGPDQIHDAHDSRTSARMASAPCWIRSRPTRAPSEAALLRNPCADARITRPPSRVATTASSSSPSSAAPGRIVARAPIGVWQPPPSVSTRARSASSATAASASLIAETMSRTAVSSSRI